MKFSAHFFRAVCDYRYMLERDYPQKSMLKMVGDRYQLASFERVMLYRGLARDADVALRQKKRVVGLSSHTELFLDGFNVCRTVGSYLNGNPVFVGLDGFLRDVSELHRKKLGWDVLEKAVGLIVGYLKEKEVAFARFYFDTPISHSGKMCEMTRQKLATEGLAGEALTVFSPDHELLQVQNGLVCTADSHIIEQAQTKVFDLPQHLLKERFRAQLFSFPDYLEGKSCDRMGKLLF